MNGDQEAPVLVPMKEALRSAGLSRATFFRWVKVRRVPDARYRDRNGYRVFTPEEIEAMRQITGKVTDTSEQRSIPFRRR